MLLDRHVSAHHLNEQISGKLISWSNTDKSFNTHAYSESKSSKNVKVAAKDQPVLDVPGRRWWLYTT